MEKSGFMVRRERRTPDFFEVRNRRTHAALKAWERMVASAAPETKKLVIFMLLLMLLAVVTKVIGCGLGAKIMRYTNKESLQIGIGMISRGEVALIVANKGASVGLMSEKFMTPLVIMVVFTTFVTPILLKLVFPKKKSGEKETVSDDLTALEKSGINTGLEES